jgi:glucosamine kinase
MYIGVDAGGSHVECAVCSEDLAFQEKKTVAPAPRAATDPSGLARTIFQAVEDLTVDRSDAIERIVVGSAGTGDPLVRNNLSLALTKLWPDASILVTTDIEIALESCFPSEPGILLAAGTGSFAAKRKSDGSVERVGGLGPALGDKGSAFDLGRTALQTVIDSPERSPVLTASLQEMVGDQSFKQMVSSATPGQIALLAEAVCRLAVDGDGTASTIVDDAVGELVQLVVQLRDARSVIPVAFSGGLLSDDSPVRARLIGAIETSRDFVYATKTVDPVRGALSIASRPS